MPTYSHWPLSQGCNKSNGRCSVCLETHQLHLNNGYVHVHGPRNKRCAGSNKPPLSSAERSSLPDDFLRIAGDYTAPTIAAIPPCSTAANLNVLIEHPTKRGPIIKHIPKSARQHCASELKSMLDNINNNPNDMTAWSKLLNYGNSMLLAPARGGKKRNLTSILKARSVTDHLPDPVLRVTKQRTTKTELSSLEANVTSKIEDGNIKAALRILSSDDRPATDNNATVIALRARHPPMATDRMPLPSPQVYNALQVTETELIAAIKSFPAGSAGGPDGIRPQHILDLTNNQEAGPALVTSLTTFINMLLAGRCPDTVIPVFFGGSLIALEKKCGGI